MYRISVCLPVYNGAVTIADTIKSILSQSHEDFEIVVVDNASSDATCDIVRGFSDSRIQLYHNVKNIGCGGNLEACRRLAKFDLLFYICADDIADKDALKKVSEAFLLSEDIGIVVRPYYWFESDASKPVRCTKQFRQAQVVSLTDSPVLITDVIALSDQISGIAFRKKYMFGSFSSHYFIEMASMVVPVMKICKVVILRDNIVAIRTTHSGSMSHSVYQSSPMMSWYRLITETFSDPEQASLRDHLIKNFIASNYIGLVQIKNHGSLKQLLREIFYLVKFKKSNIFNPLFWFFSLGAVIVPRALLWKMVVFYKNKINNVFLKNIKLGE